MAPRIPINGTYKHTLDAKNRLFIPAKHREALGTPFVVYPSIRDSSLKICTIEEWADFMDKINKTEGKQKEVFNRFYNQYSDTLTPDSQGRIVLNQNLVSYAKFEGRGAVIVGCGTYAEIWSEEKYEELNAQTDIDAIREMLERLGL